MAVMAQSPVRARHRPAAVRFIVGVLMFLGVTASAGGVELVSGGWMAEAVPGDWLDQIPLIDSWLIPGLVLGVGFGLVSLLAAYGMLRLSRWSWLAWAERLTGRHWSWAATVLIGLGHVVWIGLEILYLPSRSWLEAVYGVVGLILLLLPWHPSARAYFAR